MRSRPALPLIAFAVLFASSHPALRAQEDDPLARQAKELSLRFARHYRPVEYAVRPALPATTFPIDPAAVAGWEDAVRLLSLSEAARERLLSQGFVAASGFFRGEATEDVVRAYEALDAYGDRVPRLVTSDALLHLYHIQFDESLKEIEEREFWWDARLLVRCLLNRAIELAGDESLREPARLAAGYLAVADELLALDAKALLADAERLESPEEFDWASAQAAREMAGKHDKLPRAPSLPDPDLAAAVAGEVEAARRHEGFADSALFDYKEDFSQYKPRGHYDRSRMLEAYFRGMMWLGRMTFLLKGGEPYGPDKPYLVPAATAANQTRAAALLTALLTEDLPDGRNAGKVWERLYSVTSYYVGLADDLCPAHYLAAMKSVGEDGEDALKLAKELAASRDALLALAWELAKLSPPAIYSGTGESETSDPAALAGLPSPEVLDKTLAKTQGFRLMGQRFIPDSYWMGRLVFPTIGAPAKGRTDMFTCAAGLRAFPRGLDVMALLGSARARAHLAASGDDAYAGYDKEFARLSAEIAKLSREDWNRNLYWSWLWCLKALLEPVGEGYPTLMKEDAWLDKSLNASLASWAELRHDTILYAKQSYTMAPTGAPVEPPPPPPGWVEPLPEFLARLVALSRMTASGLGEMNALSDQARSRLDALDSFLARLLNLSKKELEGTALDEEDARFLARLPEALEGVAAGAGKGAMKTTLVADVHTDQNSSQCLEEGTGALELLVVLAPRADGTFFVAAGPALAYYEFRHPMSSRLTDGEWRTLLGSEEAPERPSFSRSYRLDR
ncbi:MAG: DUF3160 domain-containing protein [Planctomycetes bacterium]|nr:DUF3160 domain-containing protein [Planctomycetota bacterium]